MEEPVGDESEAVAEDVEDLDLQHNEAEDVKGGSPRDAASGLPTGQR